MSFRTIEITKPSEIHIVKNQFKIKQEERKVKIPLEDIDNLWYLLKFLVGLE